MKKKTITEMNSNNQTKHGSQEVELCEKSLGHHGKCALMES